MSGSAPIADMMMRSSGTTRGAKGSHCLKELLRLTAMHHHQNDELASAAIYATALRELSPQGYKPGEFTPHPHSIHAALNERFGMNRYAYHASDSLLQMLKDELTKHGISNRTIK